MNNSDKLLSYKKIKCVLGRPEFGESYAKLITNSKITNEEIIALLKCAIAFLNFGDNLSQRLGYKIITSYSLQFKNYKPLHDVAVGLGYFPITQLLERKHLNSDLHSRSFFRQLCSAYQENFKENEIYMSVGQKKLNEFARETKSHFALIAPTSYGKSEIIISKVFSNVDKNVCIIVPSKALIAQTKKRLLAHQNREQLQRVITHSDMYKGTETSFVCILTQERLLRLFQKNTKLRLDLILIDEAHNMFGSKKNDERSTLLSQTIIIARHRNKDVVLNFYSPFISDADNLKIPQCEYQLQSRGINEFIKSERYFVCDLQSSEGKLAMYDQFSGSIYDLGKNFKSETELLESEKSTKNIIYLNRPKHIEDFAINFSEKRDYPKSDFSEIVKAISSYLHPDYNLNKCIIKGVVYHHGGMPEVVRLYVEEVFSSNRAIDFIITSSTLLEGVNIPAEKIFLLSTKKGKGNLTSSQFRNLTGRINRFSEIFNKQHGNINLLMPEIYVIKSKYESSNANIESFMRHHARIDAKTDDVVNNILLKNPDALNSGEKEILHKTLEFTENIEPNSTSIAGAVYAESEIAKLCFRNNVHDFDVLTNEPNLLDNLLNFKASLFNKATTCELLMEAIAIVFLENIELSSDDIKRLRNPSARRFYAMFLEWRRQGTSYKERIGRCLNYWSNLRGDNRTIYIGSKWGEVKRRDSDILALYVDLSVKTNSQLVNLAVIKIQEENDFVDFKLLKYIEILFELDLLDRDLYDQIKYGSSDKRIICLLKIGCSLELAKCLARSEYSQYVDINIETEDVMIDGGIQQTMKENGENEITIFEAKFHITQST